MCWATPDASTVCSDRSECRLVTVMMPIAAKPAAASAVLPLSVLSKTPPVNQNDDRAGPFTIPPYVIGSTHREGYVWHTYRECELLHVCGAVQFSIALKLARMDLRQSLRIATTMPSPI